MYQGAKYLAIVHEYESKIAANTDWNKLPYAILNKKLEP